MIPDQFLASLPKVTVVGYSYRVPIINPQIGVAPKDAAAQAIAGGTAYTADAQIAYAPSSAPAGGVNPSVEFCGVYYAGPFDSDDSVENWGSGSVKLNEQQLEDKRRAIDRCKGDHLINGAAKTEFGGAIEGLDSIFTTFAGQPFNAGFKTIQATQSPVGTGLAVADAYALLGLVYAANAMDAGNVVLLTSTRGRAAIQATLSLFGSSNLLSWGNYAGQQVSMLGPHPLLVSDHVQAIPGPSIVPPPPPPNPPYAHDEYVYLLHLNKDVGVHLFCPQDVPEWAVKEVRYTGSASKQMALFWTGGLCVKTVDAMARLRIGIPPGINTQSNQFVQDVPPAQ
jgi:hypothetical protein